MPQKAASASTKRPGDRMLKPGEAQVPAAIYLSGTKASTAARMVGAGEWIRARRQELKMTQGQAAIDLCIPLRRLKTLEAIALWPVDAKLFVRKYTRDLPAGKFTLDVANRKWGSKAALMAALQRLVEGRPPRKRPGSAGAVPVRDPDIIALEDRIRDRLGMRVTLDSDGQAGRLEIALTSIDDHERLLEVLGC